MNRKLKVWALVAQFLALIFTALSLASDVGYQPGQIIVKFSSKAGKIIAEARDGVISLGIASLDRRMQRYAVHHIAQLFPHKSSQLGRIYQIDFDSSHDARIVAGDFAQDEHLLYAEPRYLNWPCEAPDDSFYIAGWQGYLDQVHGPEAWDIAHGDSTVIIGMVDTGVDWDHPDLEDNIWVNPGEDLNGDGRITGIDWNDVDDDSNGYIDDFFGWDFGGWGYPDNNPMENPGPLGSHGTHCAGIASAVTNNNLGCAGMSWNCVVMAVKVSYDQVDAINYGYEGIQYAADNGADVINLSWGHAGGFPSQFEQEILDSAFARGVILVAAAGNDPGVAPPDTCSFYYPARYHHVTAVAATDSGDQVPYWTFYGSWVDVCAPGVSIYNTFWNDTYGTSSGTSMSGPLVVGVAGLLRSADPDIDSDEFEFRMRTTSDDIDSLNPGYEGWLGGGRLNAYRVLLSNPPQAIDDLRVELAGYSGAGSGDIRLTWTEPYDDVGVIRYVVYRSTSSGSLGDSLAGTTDTTFLDVGAAGNVEAQSFHTVKAVDGAGNTSGESNRVGEFDLQLSNAPPSL